MSTTADCSIPSKAIMVKGYSSFDYTCHMPVPEPEGRRPRACVCGGRPGSAGKIVSMLAGIGV
jgi:hypothetical protein